MKIIAVSGSPREGGNTDTALSLVLRAAAEKGMETELVRLRPFEPLGCTACQACRNTKDGTCPGRPDGLDEVFAKVYDAAALVVGSPVYFGSATPETLAFLQRLGYAARGMKTNPMAGKPAAGVAVARRAGQNFTLAEIEMCFGPLDMIRAGSLYWPIGFGGKQGEVADDDEAVRTFARLGENLARLANALAT
jgi:multimeric flavodoxin WrbA